MKTYCFITMIAVFLLLSSNGIQAQTVTDIDGNIYQTVTIGTQVWMGENLKSLHYSDGTVIPYVWEYYNSDSLTVIYGRYYSWTSAMRAATSSNSIPSGIQGACPDGWHLPSSAEWGILINYYGGELEAGGKLKEEGTSHWNLPNAGATNESGFTALPGGMAWDSGGGLMGVTGLWWTSLNENNFIYWVGMGNEVPYAGITGTYITSDDDIKGGYSVRCLKNTSATQISIIENYEQFSIYPNPVNDWIIIRLKNSTKINLSVYGLEGKLMLQRQLNQQETLIDICDLPEGIYIVSIRSSQGIMQKKIIKTSLKL
jgi:uncharacterized protein (TIGR02145 family)